MIRYEIPFRKQQFYLTVDMSSMWFALTIKGSCWSAVKLNAEINQATSLVGMGRDRNKHNHLERTFMALSREAHNEIHNIGLTEFMKKYHVRPIKLSKENLKELGPRGNYEE